MFPDSILWNFGDPASGADSISHQLSPVHVFSAGGEYEVAADVWYPPDTANPFGRYEHTSRMVTVKQSPLPDLGPDTLICKDAAIELNGGAGEGSYYWSTGDFGMNDSLITVADTGTYWVKVNAPNGCSSSDSVFVGWNPPALFLEDNLVITPTSCNASSGSITGLQVQGVQPLALAWQDADGNILGTQPDISGLGVGNYYLQVTDGNGCVTLSDSYTITDAGDIVVDTVTFMPEHCNLADGSITITAHSEATSFFNYSVNDGNSWQVNDSVFNGLISGSYIIRVSDTNGCQSVYNYNPVEVDKVPPPLATSVTVTDETNHDQNGSIVLTATGSGTLSFSIDNGNSFQNNGSFSGLTAGVYTCMIIDDFGCDTSFEVTVNRLSTHVLEALAGDGHTCLGKAALVPLVVSGFDSVKRFRVEVTYDSSVLSVTGYQNVDPSIQSNLSVQAVQNNNRVIALWENNRPVTLNNNTTLFNLLFEGKKEGYSSVDWAHSAGQSNFVNAAGEVINTEFVTGNVRIFSTPQILLADRQKVCENDNLFISPFVSGGSGAYSYSWQGPGGFTSDNDLLWINNVQQSMEGSYNFTVTDTINCEESKTIQVTVETAPVVSFAHEDTLFLSPGDLLDAQTAAAAYLWNTGDTTAAIRIDTTGIYWLKSTGSNGCKSLDTVQVLWGGVPFFIPNAFTPNGDGLNDVFKVIPRYDYVRDYVLQIYNRWGEQIFETSGSNNGWDGTFKGKPVEHGTYIYRIAYRDFQTKKTMVVQGTVVVVR
jgi:gliding motility-associated-like protein